MLNYLNNHENAVDVIKHLQPNFYCKGSDYLNKSNDINLKKEVNQLKKEGGVNKRSLRYKNNYITLVLGMKKIGFQCFVSKII